MARCATRISLVRPPCGVLRAFGQPLARPAPRSRPQPPAVMGWADQGNGGSCPAVGANELEDSCPGGRSRRERPKARSQRWAHVTPSDGGRGREGPRGPEGGPEPLLPTSPHPTRGGAPGGGRVPGRPDELRSKHPRAPAVPTPAAPPSWLLKETLWGVGVGLRAELGAAPSPGPVSCVALGK